MIRNLKSAAAIAALLLSTITAARSATITLNESIIISSANDGPVLFDFGTVSAGLNNTFAGTLRISFINPGGSALTIPAPANGTLGNCPPALASGAVCTENIDFFFAETPSTPVGIYSGHITQTFSFANAAGAPITDPVEIDWTVNVGGVPVPGPTVGAGASSFALAALFLGWLVRRRGHQLV